MSYTLRLPVFEGPLDLLLHLIRSHKLDICDVAISQVTEQYLDYLAMMESLDLDVAGEFLVMAATLMEIKSRTLLPRPEPLNPEDEGIDPREELVQKLLEYERFQQVAEQLRELATESSRSFQRPIAEEWEGAAPLVELRPADLLFALSKMRGAEDEAKGRELPPSLRVRRQAINIRQRTAEILRRVLQAEEPMRFSTLIQWNGRRIPRQEVLVTFLAILELVRQGQITAWQAGACGEIILTPREGRVLDEIPAPALN